MMRRTVKAWLIIWIVGAMACIKPDLGFAEKPEVFVQLGHNDSVISVAFSPDGRWVLSGSADKTLKLWDVATGREVRTFSGYTGTVQAVTFSPDGRWALLGSHDHTLKLWEVATGQELLTMVAFDDGEWITITPEGYYAASAKGDTHLNVRQGNRVYGIDQYRSTFYQPQVVEAALKLGDSAKAIAQVSGNAESQPTIATAESIEPPFVVSKSPEESASLSSASTTLSFYVEDRHQPLQWVKILVNGRLVTGSGDTVRDLVVVPKPDVPALKVTGLSIPSGLRTLDLAIPVQLDPGENVLEVLAFNGFSEGRRTLRVNRDQKAGDAVGDFLPNLWMLSIGINAYDDPGISSLSYAAADARAIVQAFTDQEGWLFRKVESLLLTETSGRRPTREQIVDSLDYLRQAGQHDIVLLFLAGHGVNDERGDFYFLPQDAALQEDGSFKKSKAIIWQTLERALDLPAKKLVFIDACHSEGLSGKKDVKTRGVDNDRLVKELQGLQAVTFTSARGNELAQESKEWGHGAFTYALIQGLKGEADLFPKVKDGKISMKELDTYVSETVPLLTGGAQHPITFTPEGYVNFPVAVLG